MAGRQVRIDCGANRGIVLEAAVLALPEFEHIAFEANPELIADLQRVRARHPREAIEVYHAAVWVQDGTIDLYLTDAGADPTREGSTLMMGKRTGGVDYAAPRPIPAIDFDRFLRERFDERDTLVVKMDIEGAEYDVLERMVEGGSLGLVAALLVETHAHKISAVTPERHDALLGRLTSRLGRPFLRDDKHIAWARAGVPSPALHVRMPTSCGG